MKILIDSREQLPLFFRYEYITEAKVIKLDVGDYGCEFSDGFIPPIFFERKGLGDLFSTMGQGYSRFKKEIARAADSNVKLIILVEGTMSEVRQGFEYSTLTGISIIRKLMTLQTKYDIDFQFLSRREMGLFIYEYFCSLGRLKGKKHGGTSKAL